MTEVVQTSAWMQRFFWSGAGAVVLAWGVTLYWALVAWGYLDAPWSLP